MSNFDYWIATCQDCDHACRADTEAAVITAFAHHATSKLHPTAQLAHVQGVRLDVGGLEIGLTP